MLKIDSLTASYRNTEVLKNVSFSLTPHTFTAVLGKNGCGKSTLVSCINQQLRYTGKISFGDHNLALMPLRERARAVAILPQVMEIPHVPVEDLVMFGRNPYLDFGRRPSSEDRAAVESAIAQIGIEALREKMVDHLSGGERQRAYLAMVLAQQTRLIVLDEPTTYMDMENEAAFLQTLTQLKKRSRKTLLVIMHNLAQAVRYADHIVVLDGGRVVFDGATAACLESGVLERVFHVQKHIFSEGGQQFVVFTAQNE